MNRIYLRRRSKIVLPRGSGTTPLNVIATIQKNLESLGFALSEELSERLTHSNPAQVEHFYDQLVRTLRELVGAHRPFTPMYPNFPQQVMEMHQAELYFNALMHYLTLTLPETETAPREPLDSWPSLREIRLGSRDDFEEIFRLLARSKSPYSAQDQEDVKWFFAQYGPGILRLLPDEIPCRENLAILGAALMLHVPDAVGNLDSKVRTATDVLRIAAAMSDGDVSLAVPCKFGKFRRSERALLLSWIERSDSRTEDMLRWKPRWIRLGERLHPGEYAKRFPKTAAAFDVLRNDRPSETFNSHVETRLAARDWAAALDLLDTRPGDFARRLDHVARIANENALIVVDQFALRASSVSTPVLLQALAHFRNRDRPLEIRTFFPKGGVAKVHATTDRLPDLPEGISAQIATICERTLVDRFAKLPPLGRCFLDDRLKSYLVPFSQRSASKSLRTLVRGSRIPFQECSTLRFFLWWKNGTSRTDIDLSATMFDKDFRYLSTLSYYNLADFGGHHSGDIVDAPRGAAEFIDIDVRKMLDREIRYVVMCLNSFTEQPYCDLPECFAGWMAREKPDSGEIFEPKTVADKVDLASDTRICIPAIFDLVDREVLWADIALSNMRLADNNVSNNLGGVSLMLQALTQLRKLDLHSLFEMHIRARGEFVGKVEEADSIFSVEQGITPFDLDRIMADFV